jgi:hypothetical protein
VSSSLNQILAPSTIFPIELTPIVNQTAPLNHDHSSRFSAIWSYSFNVKADELFTNESRYTFFYRTQTSISVIISPSIFYVSNLQQPITKQTEVIFRSLLFTIVVLEVFGLIFLLIKLFLVPTFRSIASCVHRYQLRKTRVNTTDDVAIAVVQNHNLPKITKQAFENPIRFFRWSTIRNLIRIRRK